MRPQRRQWERGYALSEAMVGGVVLLFAISGVLAGFIQARRDVSRATSDRLASQLAAAQVELLRAMPYALPTPVIRPNWIIENNQQCSVEVRNQLALQPPAQNWTCKVDVQEITDPAVSTTAGVRTYKRARITLGYRGQTWITETLRW
jgi:Tfp pilus assembly protein PilV